MVAAVQIYRRTWLPRRPKLQPNVRPKSKLSSRQSSKQRSWLLRLLFAVNRSFKRFAKPQKPTRQTPVWLTPLWRLQNCLHLSTLREQDLLNQ